MMNIQGFRRYAKTLGKFATTFLLALLTQSVFAAAPQTVTYYYTDPQGTVLATTDAQGNILTQADRRPYGEQVMGTPQDGPGYTGHVGDSDSGLIYMQARYYDPTISRFFSTDSAPPKAGDIFNFNRFGYTNNNPITSVDLDGKQTLPLSVYSLNWQDPVTREVATTYALNSVPGYGLYACASEGCSGAGWSVAVVSTGLSAVGAVGRVGAIARAANGSRALSQAASQAEKLNNLQEAVRSVHGAMNDIAQTRRATAGALLQDGRMVFASGASQNLNPAQRAIVQSLGGEMASGARGLHAEQKILNFANEQGTSVQFISTEGNRAICAMCQSAILEQGGFIVDKYNALW